MNFFSLKAAKSTAAASLCLLALGCHGASDNSSQSVPLTQPSNPPTPLVSVLTRHNDASRSGANTLETQLRPSNLNAQTFGKIFSYPVDGEVYAFDADSFNLLWTVHLGPSQPIADYGGFASDMAVEVGITGTPVIDRQINALFVSVANKDADAP